MGSVSTRSSAARVATLFLVTAAMTALTITSVFAVAPQPPAAPLFVSVPAPRSGVDNPPPGATPGRDARIVSNVAYGTAARQRLDLYLPDAHAFPGPRPVIVWLHPGGWISSSRNDTTPIVQREVARGFAVASIDYALAPEYHFPTPLEDVKLAIRWVKTAGHFAGLDPAKVILAGGSAGGYLATMAAVTPGRFEPASIPPPLAGANDTVAAVVDFVGPTDLAAFNDETGNATLSQWSRSLGDALLGCTPSRPCTSDLEHDASVAPYLSAQAPPIFMAYGAADTVAPPTAQAIPLARAWAAATSADAVWLEVLARRGHNISLAALNDRALDQFLDDVVSGSIG
jgi:acetyl esterase/lipase